MIMRETWKQNSALGWLRISFLQAFPLILVLITLVLSTVASIPACAQPAQGGIQQPQAGAANPAPQNNSQPVQQLPPDTIRPNYVLGPNDQILIRAPEAEEIDNRPFRIDGDGNINLPLVGHVHAAGMSLQEFEADLVKRLREYIREPQVFVQIAQYRSEPVFFVGLFARPGAYPLQGNRTLIEMLTAVGGLQTNADRHIKITRQAEYGTIPLPDAVVDPEKKVSTVEISLGNLRQNLSPAENILLQPYDEISVGRAEQVWVNGEVGHVGGVPLEERESISIAQVLTQSGGFTRDAKKSKVRILRPVEGTTRRAVIEVDVADLFEGKALDVPLYPGDIVYVPRSYARQFWQTVSTVALPLLPYILFLITQ
jgi:polysaccharide biosynthesis/export protein